MNDRSGPLYVTFDTNTYSSIANPQPRKLLEKWWPLDRDRWQSKKLRVKWWYIAQCIRKGRVVAGIPEALLATEALPNVSRIALLLSAGTPTPRPPVPAVRIKLIRQAIDLGFRVMHMPRIGHPSTYQVAVEEWSLDVRFSQSDRLNRSHLFSRHFNDYAHVAVRDFGEQLATAHGLSSPRATFAARFTGISPARHLWREGLAAEDTAPKMHASPQAFQKVLRSLLADWADFDVAATHYGYGYDYICTEDLGSASSNSIFGPQHATGAFNVRVVTASELARLCWIKFGFPMGPWR